MSQIDREKWDARYADRVLSLSVEPDAFLAEQIGDVPPGRALDLACGLGHNAIWLAQTGWTVDAADISPVGLRLAKQQADRLGSHVNWILADLDEFSLPVQAYDLVIVFRFLDRKRLPRQIESSLRPNGRLIYETFTIDQFQRKDNRLRNPMFVLQPGELPKLFSDLSITMFREGEYQKRNVAQLVACKNDS